MGDKRIKQLEDRIADLSVQLNEATARARNVGGFAGQLIDELARRLQPGDAGDQVLAAKVLGALSSIGGTIDPETEKLLKSI